MTQIEKYFLVSAVPFTTKVDKILKKKYTFRLLYVIVVNTPQNDRLIFLLNLAYTKTAKTP